MKQLGETLSVPRRTDVVYTLCCGQSLSEIALLEETLCQPEFRQGPIRRQFGRALKSGGGAAGVFVGKEGAACAEEVGRFVYRPEIAEELAPIILPAENVSVFFLDDGRVQPQFFAALVMLVEIQIDVGADILGIEVERTVKPFAGFGQMALAL